MPKTNGVQCSKRRSKNDYPSGFVSTLEERIPVKNCELQDYLQHGASQLHHDRENSPLHLTNVFKLRNATEACVVVEPLNISSLKSIKSLCGKRKFISDQETSPVVDESSTAITPYSQILQAKKSRTDQMPSRKGEAPKSSNHFEQESKPSWYTKNMHLDKILSRCKEVIDKCVFEIKSHVPENDTVKRLIGELEGLLSTAELPQTIIVLMGGIGTGKSTLVNALLDRNCVLPTSDDRACTSVVVEVVQNTNTDKMEAVVQFLGKSDWLKEIEMLLDDLKCRDGLRMIKPPDPSSDIYSSYCKVMAVYGKIDTLECLSNNNSVNKWLGQTHHIMCNVNEGDTFQDQIAQFITGNKHGPNTQSLWPIIKHVLIKVPNADVCSSGASLVDLPGIGDANPARDEITAKFLKECHSVWIINAMTRASDDVTSRNLLDQGVRRQIIMDGKMESIAFVCTMSDRFCEHNTIRDHALGNLCKDLKAQKCSMELEKRHLEQKIKCYMDSEDILKAKARIWEIHGDIMKKNYAISKVCARARNEVCIRHIQQLYQNIKMHSILIPDHHDGDDSDMEVHLKDWKYDKSDEDGVESNIRVFCCSSTEYQKISGCIPAYGPPLVFNEAEETQVPALKEYVHELTYARREKGLERFIRRLGRCVFTFQGNVQTVIDMDTNAGRGIEAAICDELSTFQELTQTLINSLGESLEKLFRGNIRHLLQKGATNAKMDACMICNKWGPPVHKTLKRGQVEGLHWRSYRATVQRRGVFTLYLSKAEINFNRDLVEPIYKEIENEWNRIFDSQIPHILENTSKVIYNKTLLCLDSLCKRLEMFSLSKERVVKTKMQMELTCSGKLSEFQSDAGLEIIRRQREINRLLTPFIRLSMDHVYMYVANQTGKGSSEDMKKCMLQGIDNVRHTMFDEAIEMLQGELRSLQIIILNLVAAQCEKLREDMRKAYEPFWKSSTNSVTSILSVLNTACDDVREIYADANLVNTDEVPNSASRISHMSHSTPTEEHTLKQLTMDGWQSSIHSVLRNGTSEEIKIALSACPSYESAEVLRPFDNESQIQSKLLAIITELLQNRLISQGYNVFIWTGYALYKNDHVLFCAFSKRKPQLGRFFNKEVIYIDSDYLLKKLINL